MTLPAGHNVPMQRKASPTLPEATLRPLSARSVVLSLLLGLHPPELPVRELVRGVEQFGIAESTLRVALTRMVAAGDLNRVDTTYRLSDRLLARQRRQDDALSPRLTAWQGDWEIAVVTTVGRGPAERAELRADLSRLRLAELREGVWMRPANLRRPWPDPLTGLVQRFTARPDEQASALVRALWTLEVWAGTARELLELFRSAARPADRLATAAAIMRHLVTDPALPAELLPVDWPGETVRQTYAGYQAELIDLVRRATSEG